MDTMREELVTRRKELLEPTKGEIGEAYNFVNVVLKKLYEKQVDDDPKLDVCAVVLKYDGVQYYQVTPWDPETRNFISRGESKIHEKLLNLVLELAQKKDIWPIPEDEAEKLGIIPKNPEVNELEEKWGWKDSEKFQRKEKPKETLEVEEASNAEEEPKDAEEAEIDKAPKKDWYLLFDVSIGHESVEEPQKEMG